MKELSLHILDIMQNSITAKATLIRLELEENVTDDFLEFKIIDNGCGMTKEQVSAVIDPFTTSRKTRKVGLGIPLLKTAAEQTGGWLSIESVKGEGTTLLARFGYSHIDRQPLGDMAETMLGLITAYGDIDFVYTHKVNGKGYELDTRQMREMLGEVSFGEPAVMIWISEFLRENEEVLYNE